MVALLRLVCHLTGTDNIVRDAGQCLNSAKMIYLHF